MPGDTDVGAAIRSHLEEMTVPEIRDLVRGYREEIPGLEDVKISQNKTPLIESVAEVLEDEFSAPSALQEVDPLEVSFEPGQEVSTTGDADSPIEDEEDQDETTPDEEGGPKPGVTTAPPLSRSVGEVT